MLKIMKKSKEGKSKIWYNFLYQTGEETGVEKVREKVLFALQEVQRAVIGKQEVTETVMKAFLAGGHVLVEDIPGLGKTTMAIAFS